MRRVLTAAMTVALAVALTPAAHATQRGGSLIERQTTDVDFLDPGKTYFTVGFEVAFAVGRPLYSEVPGTAGVVPDLASGPPQVSADARTVTVPLRAGVMFGPPASREVTAGDVKYAFQRAFLRSVENQYATAYFGTIVGAPRRPATSLPALGGITTPDAHTIVFRLSQPAAAEVSAALMMPISIPVPAEVAGPYDAHVPSTYNTHVVSSGPYQIAQYKDRQSILLTRNPSWVASTDIRPAYADAIRIFTAQPSLGGELSMVTSGSGELLGDGVGPDRLGSVPPAQVATIPAGGTRYVALNARSSVFRTLAVRKAVALGLNRDRLRASRGGAALGPIATHFLPPGFPGYDEAGGAAGPGAYPSETGDVAAARKALKGVHGRTITVVGANAAPGLATLKELSRQLVGLGFRVKARAVPQDAVYVDYCQQLKDDVCASAGWFKDFEDPQSMIQPIFATEHVPHGYLHSNLSGVGSPALDRAMAKAAALPAGEARLQAWAAADDAATRLYTHIPFLWDTATFVRSANVDAPLNPYTTEPDLSFSGLSG